MLTPERTKRLIVSLANAGEDFEATSDLFSHLRVAVAQGNISKILDIAVRTHADVIMRTLLDACTSIDDLHKIEQWLNDAAEVIGETDEIGIADVDWR